MGFCSHLDSVTCDNCRVARAMFMPPTLLVTTVTSLAPDPLRLDPDDPASVERLARAYHATHAFMSERQDDEPTCGEGIEGVWSDRSLALAIARAWKEAT